MKKISLGLIFISIFILVGCGQPQVPKSQLIYTKIIEHSKNSDDAYELSRMWLASAFVDSKEVIEYSNKENATIIGKGIVDVNYGLGLIGKTKFNIKIENKNNKTRFTLDNISISTYDRINGTLKYDMWNADQFNRFSIEADKIVNGFEKHISTDNKNNNW